MFRSIVAWMVVASVSLAARADDQSVTIAPNYHVGMSWTFDSSQSGDMTNKYLVNNQVAQTASNSMQMHRSGTVQVMEVKDGLPTAVKVTFDNNCTTTITQGNQKQNPAFVLAGQTVTIRRDDNDRVTTDYAGQLDAGTVQQELRLFVEPDTTYYPKGPVTVGKEWPGDPAALTRMFQLQSKNDSAGLTAQLLSLKQVDGRSVAEVKVSMACIKEQADQTTNKTIMQGIILIDLQTGHAISADIKGPITVTGDRTGPNGEQVHLDGQGNVSMKITRPLKADAVAANVAPAPANPTPAPGPSNPVSPAPPANPGDNPMGKPQPPPAPVDPVAGVYSNDKVQIDVSGDGTNYTGTIVFGGQKFPYAGKYAVGRLTGNFTAKGNPFPFTATINGNDMTFETGEGTSHASYSLKKQAAANPMTPGEATPPAPAIGVPVADGKDQLPADAIRLTPTAIDDPMARRKAGTILVPSGWKVDGGIIWRNNAFYPVALNMKVGDPKSPTGLWIMPGFLFVNGMRESAARIASIAGPQAAAAAAANYPEGAFYMGSECRRVIQDPADFVKQMVIPRLRPDLANAKVVAVEEVPSLEKAAIEKNGFPGLTAKASRVRFEYVQGGVTVEEDLYCSLIFMPMPGNTLNWGNDVLESYRAPKGQLDQEMHVFRCIDRSIRPDMGWFAEVAQVSQAMQQGIKDSIDAAGQLSRYIAKNADETSKEMRESYEQREAVVDKANDDFDRTIRGVEQYHDPYQDKPVEVPLGYDHAFVNPSGEVIVTNDHLFKPTQAFNGDWSEMKKGQ